MAASDRVSPGFWVICPEDFRGPAVVDLPGLGRAVALFSSEDEVLLYLGLLGADGPRARRVSGAGLLTLLSGRWAGYRSVALDPIPKLDAGTLLPLTTTSRERFVRFLRSTPDRGREYRVARSAVSLAGGGERPGRGRPNLRAASLRRQKVGHEAATGAEGGEDRSVGDRWCEGYALLDPLGQSLGRVERVFCNRAGEPQYVRIRAGLFGNRLVLIPVLDVAVDHENRTITLR